jgi:REP element-mobilizing transposase RayT
MRLIFVCSKDDPAYPEAVAFKPEGLLNKPFYLPDLLETVARVLQTPLEGTREPASTPTIEDEQPTEKKDRSAIPEWLQDVNQAAQHLTRLSLESDAQAALILKDGLLWAYAGQLGQSAAQELSDSLAAIWYPPTQAGKSPASARERRGDMVRLFRLETTGDVYMVYATSLGNGLVLSMAFNSNTPFSSIRSQAGYLVKALYTPPDSQLPPSPRFRLAQATNQRLTGGSHQASTRIAPLLENIPTPLPHKDITKQPTPTLAHDRSEVIPPGANPERAKSTIAEESKAPPSRQAAGISASKPDTASNPAYSDLRPTSPALHSLTYAGMLIPRLPQHRLAGDLAERLQEWLDQLCLAFGWQVETINIQPEYLQCIIRVNPITSPSYLMRIIRQQTSQRIFIAFPLLAQENPSGDFWAPGYLILSNSQLPPAHITQHFLEQTRQQQGIHHLTGLRPS